MSTNSQIEIELLKVQEKYFKAQKALLDGNAKQRKNSMVMTMQQLEILSRSGDVASCLGVDYLPMNQFDQCLRMPSPPFLFVSRILSVSTQKNSGILGRLEFEYDIPIDTPFQCCGKPHEFILAESCHALVYLAYLLLKEELLLAPSGLRGSNGKLCIYTDMPDLGETVRGCIEVHALLDSPAGKLLKIRYDCYHRDERLLLLENYSAVINPNKSTSVELNIPKNFCSEVSEKYFDNKKIDAFFAGDFSKVFNQSKYDAVSFQICHKMNKLLDRVRYDSVGGIFGKGYIIGEFDLKEDHWVFGSHFVNDPLFPASLMSFGMFQLLVFFAFAIGIYPSGGDFYPIQYRNKELIRKLINPIYPDDLILYFRLDISRIEEEIIPKLLSKGILFSDNYIYSEFENFGIEFKEKNGD